MALRRYLADPIGRGSRLNYSILLELRRECLAVMLAGRCVGSVRNDSFIRKDASPVIHLR